MNGDVYSLTAIVMVFMYGAYLWGKHDGTQRGILKGVTSLFWWFEDKAGIQQVNKWIDNEPNALLKENFMEINKYRECDEVIGLILNRSDEDE